MVKAEGAEGKLVWLLVGYVGKGRGVVVTMGVKGTANLVHKPRRDRVLHHESCGDAVATRISGKA